MQKRPPEISGGLSHIYNMTTEKLYWWISINRDAKNASPQPMPITVEVVPTPEILLGFTTQEDQMRALDDMWADNGWPAFPCVVIYQHNPQPPDGEEFCWVF